MPIIDPYSAQTVDLQHGKGSAIQDADVYVKPAVPQPDQATDQLVNSLAQFGGTVNKIADQRSNLKEQQDLERVDYFAAQALKEAGTSAVSDAQLGVILPEQSNLVRGRVAEKLGSDAATEWMTQQREAILQDPALRLNPELMDQKLKALEQEAVEKSAGAPFYGAGFVKGVRGGINAIRETAQGERSKYYDQQQTEQIQQDYEQRVNGNRQGSLPSFAQGSPGAQNIMAMDASQIAKPLAVARTLVGTSERRDAEVIASFIRQGSGKNIDPSVTPWCGAFVDSVLGKSGLAQRGSLRAADFATYGTDARSDPRQGDVIVLKPQARGSSGHVGFVAAVNPDGSYDILGGNQSNGVNIKTVPANQVVAIRRPQEGQFKQDADRASHGGTPQDFSSRVSYAESQNDPTATSSTSSASGTAQFTQSTWLGYVKQNRPDLAEGKTDAQVLALRSDPKLSAEMTSKYAEDNAKTLSANGLPVNNTNLYLSHVFDGKGATKILKANDGTPVEQVLSPDQLKANPQLAGMTTGEVREWAAKKMGAPVDGTLASQNSVRSLDRVYAKSSSLDDIRRRDAMSSYAANRAVDSLDTHYIDAFPPELITPDIQGKFDKARRQVEDLKFQQYQHSRQKENDIREDTGRKAIDEINGDVAAGKEIDPRKYASNSTAYNYAYQIQQQDRNIAPQDSVIASQRLNADIEQGALTGDYSKVLGDEYKAKSPNINQLQDVIRHRTDITAKDKIALINGLQQTLDIGTVAKSPEVDAFYTRRIAGFARGASQMLMTKLGAEMTGLNIEGEAKSFYEDEVHDRIKSFAQSKGHTPYGEELRGILKEVEKDTNEHIAKLANGGVGPSSAPAAKATGPAGITYTDTPAKPPVAAGTPPKPAVAPPAKPTPPAHGGVIAAPPGITYSNTPKAPLPANSPGQAGTPGYGD